MTDVQVEQPVATEQRNRRKRGPRKPKENADTVPQDNLAEGSKPQNDTRRRRGPRSTKQQDPSSTVPATEETGRRRERAPLVLTPDADGVAEVRVAASRPREIYAVPVRQAFASETATKVVLRALGAGIPNAIYAADELFRAGVCGSFAVEADTIVTEEDEAVEKTRRTPRILISLTRSSTWDPLADPRLPKTSPSN